MWLSGEREKAKMTPAPAEQGVVTLAHGELAVYLDGERRRVSLYAPGGLAWRPRVGERVLILKGGQEGEELFLLGKECLPPEPGQTRLGSGTGSILCGDGVEITGELLVNGEPLENMIRRIALAAVQEKEES